MKKRIELIFLDIRFWIILFFIIRLIGITNPPLEVAHNWRQTVVTMVSRNFIEIDNNILYPRVDFAGEKTGITGMEFPLLNYLIYLVSEIFGYEHWYGRLINLIVSSFGLYYFYKLIKKYFEPKIAFHATLVLLFSIWFSYSRKIMPDTFAMSFIIASIYYGSNYLDNKTKKNQFTVLLLYVLMLTLGTLSKLPSAYLLVVFFILFFNNQISLNRKTVFILASIVGLLFPYIWYFYWVPHLVETHGFWHFFMGKSITQGIHEIGENLPLTLHRFYDTALKYIGFSAFLLGLIYGIINKQRMLIYVLIVSFFGFLIIIFKSGFNFPHHSYYIIPFVPVMALIAGYGITILSSRFQYILLGLIAVEGIANQQHDFFIKENQVYQLKLEEKAAQFIGKNDLVIINGGDSPQAIYFAHRKGWTVKNEEIQTPLFMDSLTNLGAKYLIIDKVNIDLKKLPYHLINDDDDYSIYQLKN